MFWSRGGMRVRTRCRSVIGRVRAVGEGRLRLATLDGLYRLR